MSAVKKYGIFTLVMLGDRYVPGAAVFGKSARDHFDPVATAPHVDLVCMVTSDVSAAGRQLLEKVFDRVVEVQPITGEYTKYSGVFDAKYSSWIRQSYTKWNCLAFTEYIRVGFFDADCLINSDLGLALMNPEHANHPAGVFCNSWSASVMKITPERIREGKVPMRDLYEPYYRDGIPSIMPREPLRQALFSTSSWTQGMCFVPAGSSIFFRPFPQANLVFQDFLSSQTRLGNPSCGGSGPDDQMIVKFLLDHHPVHFNQPWQFLHAGWCYIPWKPELLLSQGLSPDKNVVVSHFFNMQKPWEMERDQYPDLQRWWSVFDTLPKSAVAFLPIAPSPKSRSQLSFLVATENTVLKELSDTLYKVATSQLREYPDLQTEFWEKLRKLARDHPSDDEQVYSMLRSFLHDDICCRPRYKSLKAELSTVGATDSRAQSRAQDLVSLFPKTWKASDKLSILDVGCGNGTISSMVAESLPYDIERVAGCDVKSLVCVAADSASSRSLEFTQLPPESSSGSRLPYDDNSFDIVLALMTLHHMKSPEAMISEIARCLRERGIVAVREHDLNDKRLACVIDVQHALYERVWPTVPESDNFCDMYYAKYRRKDEWVKAFRALGLVPLPETSRLNVPHGAVRSFYSLFMKVAAEATATG